MIAVFLNYFKTNFNQTLPMQGLLRGMDDGCYNDYQKHYVSLGKPSLIKQGSLKKIFVGMILKLSELKIKRRNTVTNLGTDA